jgi:Domain of unknown function (DUF5664)
MSNDSSTPKQGFLLESALKPSTAEAKRWPSPPGHFVLNEERGETNFVPAPSKPSEVDPQGLDSKVPGAKLDKGKIDVLRGAIQYFPKALEAVAHVSELGARKYSWMGWKSVPDGIRRYGAALARHLVYEPNARDAGAGGLGPDVLHAAQVAWNALARLELIIQEEENAQKPS